jgi:hypothetical protein
MNDDFKGGTSGTVIDSKKGIALGAGLGMIFGTALGHLAGSRQHG